MLYVENHQENELQVAAQNNDHKELMHRVLASLPSLQRSMMLLKDYEGYSYAEIANILSITEGQVKINLFRARKKMKDLLQTPQNTNAL